jgi:hypothetical protein
MSKKSPKKHIYYDDKCSKLEIVLTYNGKNETLSIDNKENISSIKEKVYILFYPIQGKFQLIYKNKDISPFEDIPLYKYFKNLMKVSITVQSISSSTIQNILSNNINSSFNNSLQDITAIDKNDSSLGNTNTNQNQVNAQNQNNLLKKERMLCNDCRNKLIGYFCRNCNIFICKTCTEKYSSIHRSHSTVPINVSQIEKSAKNYKDLVSKECFNSEKKYDEFNTKNNIFVVSKSEINNNVNEENDNKKEENGNENQNDKKEKRDIDGWLNDMNTKIEKLSEIFTKNDETNININKTLQDEENNYEILLKTIQKINAEKNTKDLETIFNEMHNIDDDIKTIDGSLEQCINNSESNKSNNKVLKELNKNLDNIINKLVKSMDLTEKTNENSINNI